MKHAAVVGLVIGGIVTGLAAVPPSSASAIPMASHIHFKVHEKRRLHLVRVKKKRRLSRAQRNQLIAMSMVERRGWPYRQYECLNRLWTAESG